MKLLSMMLGSKYTTLNSGLIQMDDFVSCLKVHHFLAPTAVELKCHHTSSFHVCSPVVAAAADAATHRNCSLKIFSATA